MCHFLHVSYLHIEASRFESFKSCRLHKNSINLSPLFIPRVCVCVRSACALKLQVNYKMGIKQPTLF